MLRSLCNLLRLITIACILARHKVLFFWRGEMDAARATRLARALHDLGPTFIKLGQALSTRSDLIGQEAALALAQLQDRLPAFSGARARAIIQEQLGKPVEELFIAFEDKAAAAASIAQVHFASLPGGKEVAVKVLRPGITKAFARDIALFYWLADMAHAWRQEWQRFRLIEVVRTLEDMISLELDLRFEAAAAVELKTNLKHDSGFYVPEVYWNLTAQQVLTIERIYGTPISDVEALKKAGHSLPSLVDIAAVSFFNQVFRDGFFHGDLHPGNLFVLPNGTIAVVDFGIMGRLDKKSRLYLAQILHGFLTEDYMNLAQVHFDAGLVPANKSVENFALALMALTKPIIGQKLSDISVGRLLGQLFATAKAFEMQVQPHLLLLQKNMMITEGVGRMLNPDVNMWQIAAPLIGQWAKDNLSPRAQLKEHALEAFALAKRLPSLVRQTESALSRITDGGLKLHPVTLASLKEQRSRYHREWLRFAWAVLLAVCACIYYTKR